MHEKTLSSKTVFTGRIFRVETLEVQLEDGRTAYREVVRHPGAVAVLARRPDGRFLFVRQFRVAADRQMLEIVAGILEPGEDPEAAARRELREETGYVAVSMRPMGAVRPSPGYVDETIRLFYADVGAEAGPTDLDADERVQVVPLTAAEFRDMIRRGEIEDAKTLGAWTIHEASLRIGGSGA